MQIIEMHIQIVMNGKKNKSKKNKIKYGMLLLVVKKVFISLLFNYFLGKWIDKTMYDRVIMLEK